MGSPQSPSVVTVEVWDLPVRLFHWLLVAAVAAAGVTGHLGGSWLIWHERAGVALLGLVVFRLLWGVLGTTHARFTQFLPSPAALRAALRGQWRGVGHPPTGALAMLAILALVGLQAVTGLFTNDEVDYQAPLASLVSSELSNRATWLHQGVFVALAVLIGLHLIAIAYHSRPGRQGLVRPMVTGTTQVPAELVVPRSGGGAVRFFVAATVAALIAWGAGSGALARQLAPPPPPPPTSVPSTPPSW